VANRYLIFEDIGFKRFLTAETTFVVVQSHQKPRGLIKNI